MLMALSPDEISEHAGASPHQTQTMDAKLGLNPATGSGYHSQIK